MVDPEFLTADLPQIGERLFALAEMVRTVREKQAAGLMDTLRGYGNQYIDSLKNLDPLTLSATGAGLGGLYGLISERQKEEKDRDYANALLPAAALAGVGGLGGLAYHAAQLPAPELRYSSDTRKRVVPLPEPGPAHGPEDAAPEANSTLGNEAVFPGSSDAAQSMTGSAPLYGPKQDTRYSPIEQVGSDALLEAGVPGIFAAADAFKPSQQAAGAQPPRPFKDVSAAPIYAGLGLGLSTAAHTPFLRGTNNIQQNIMNTLRNARTYPSQYSGVAPTPAQLQARNLFLDPSKDPFAQRQSGPSVMRQNAVEKYLTTPTVRGSSALQGLKQQIALKKGLITGIDSHGAPLPFWNKKTPQSRMAKLLKVPAKPPAVSGRELRHAYRIGGRSRFGNGLFGRAVLPTAAGYGLGALFDYLGK